jgi:hypothetical protein
MPKHLSIIHPTARKLTKLVVLVLPFSVMGHKTYSTGEFLVTVAPKITEQSYDKWVSIKQVFVEFFSIDGRLGNGSSRLMNSCRKDQKMNRNIAAFLSISVLVSSFLAADPKMNKAHRGKIKGGVAVNCNYCHKSPGNLPKKKGQYLKTLYKTKTCVGEGCHK